MKHDEIYDELLREIVQGRWKEGEKLPTERDLSESYGVSRPTIGRVLNRLRAAGYVQRSVGAGTFLTKPQDKDASSSKTFGLFVPGLGRGEIFEPICARIAELSHAFNFSLTWGSIPLDQDENHEELLRMTAQRFIDNGIDGVFYQPVEREPGLVNKNLKIVSMFENAKIPIVLLDSDFVTYPERSRHDLVGIDNVQAALVLCNHFLEIKRDRVDFLWQPNTAGTFALRLIGYREALGRAGIEPSRKFEHEGDPRDRAFVKNLIEDGARDIVCVNDETAVLLMKSLDDLGFAVPSDVRIAGFDDLKFARLARVALTTMHQPCHAIGELALSAMLERVSNPALPARTITVPATLQVRESSRIPAGK